MTDTTTNNGKLIHQAQEILRKTYKEVNKIRQDLTELISDYDSSIVFTEEYSYGTKLLTLKSHHTSLFKEELDEARKSDGVYSQKVFAAVIIFNDDADELKRVNLKEEPEIWFLSLSSEKRSEDIRPWHVYKVLTETNRIKGNLEASGKPFSYAWTEDDEDKNEDELETWKGEILGFPLISIKDKEFLKINVIDKLLIKKD